MNDILLTLFQALQLAALGPCLFIVAFLLLTGKDLRASLVPSLYFVALSASFMIPLLSTIAPSNYQAVLSALLFLESLTPSLSFLLILQFLYGRPAPWPYWLVLAIPIVGGSSFIYGYVYFDDVCLLSTYCIETDSLKVLYSILSAALIFLLLVAHYSLSGTEIDIHDKKRHHKYWLIMALIMLNLQLMIVDLAMVAERLDVSKAEVVSTFIRIGFIYLVMTSLFRVFDETILLDSSRIPTLNSARAKDSDEWMIKRITEAMEEKHLYREMGRSREDVSEELGIPEHQLSRVINAHFGKNFNEFLNSYRIKEAQYRLVNEDAPITAIAYDVGFSSIASFNRVFKTMVGMSPSAYRMDGKRA